MVLSFNLFYHLHIPKFLLLGNLRLQNGVQGLAQLYSLLYRILLNRLLALLLLSIQAQVLCNGHTMEHKIQRTKCLSTSLPSNQNFYQLKQQLLLCFLYFYFLISFLPYFFPSLFVANFGQKLLISSLQNPLYK